MYVIEVIPLIRGTHLESLSYYSSISYEVGTFLQVPIRGKNKPAIVTNTTTVGTAKTALKAATFSLRKLPNQTATGIVPQALRETAQKLSEQYPASLGSILFTLLPTDIRNGLRTYKDTGPVDHREETTPQVLMARLDERYRTYQSHIRSTFAKRGSVLFIVPTSTDVAYAKKELGHGITDRIITITATTSKKAYTEIVAALEDTKFSKLIITTPPFAYCGRSDITSIIVEQAASAHYIARSRPYLDHRDVLTTYAKAQGASIIIGDTVVRTEEEAKRRQDIYLTYGEEVRRLVFPSPLHIVKQNDKPSSEVPFQLFSPSLIKSVTATLEGKGHVFLYSARRGLAPVVACIDCGYIFRCPDSHTPYSLIRTIKNGVEERWFVSSTSGKRARAKDVCDKCGSWRLKERGIGIQHVYDEWKALFPQTDVTLLDHNTAPTPQRVERTVKEFFAKKGGILIGTQVAIPHLHRGVDMSAIISLDAARSTPTWRADESLFRLIMKLRECSIKEVLIQTRSDIDPLLEYANKGAVERFFDDEISLREQLQYPPFSTFILLSWSGTEAIVRESEQDVGQILTSPLAEFYTNPYSTPAHTIRHVLMRISHTDSAGLQTALEQVRHLPPYVKIEINPERIV